MCHRQFEHGEEPWNRKDPRSENNHDMTTGYSNFFERCPNLKEFLELNKGMDLSRESIEEQLRIAYNDLTIDMNEIDRLEKKAAARWNTFKLRYRNT